MRKILYSLLILKFLMLVPVLVYASVLTGKSSGSKGEIEPLASEDFESGDLKDSVFDKLINEKHYPNIYKKGLSS